MKRHLPPGGAAVALTLGAALSGASASAGCGPTPEACRIDGGSYHIVLPPDATGALSALVFLHGWGASGEAMLNDEGTVAQGDVWQALQLWRAGNGCRPEASGHGETGIFWRRSWHDCESGRKLDLALFGGGHAVPEGWTAMALDWFEGL